MAEESKKDVGESVTSTETEIKKTKKKRGVFSRLWNAMTRSGGDDFEKRLQHISKEEASILARVARRSKSWRSLARQLIIFSVLLEVIAVGYAIMTTRTLNLNWKMRALRVLPMFLLPALSGFTYYAVGSYTRMRDRKDHKTLEKLRAERQAKIDELKEKTNYYITQQLIQRYDPDPAAKAAAATVLASKLGADSGLKLYVGDDQNAPTGKSNDVEVAARTSSGLRNRKAPHTKTNSMDQSLTPHAEEGTFGQTGLEGADISQQGPLVVEHHNPQVGLSANDGGWIARVAALLVGEDPTQSYALICGNCHMHNGLARKEEYPFITYYCPHCHALNKPKQSGERTSGAISPAMTSTPTVESAEIVRTSGSISPTMTSTPTVENAEIVPSAGASTDDTILPATNSPLAAAVTGTSES